MIGSFLKRHMAAEDVWLAACILLMLSTAALLFAVNAASFHFTGISYFPRQEIALLFPVIELAAFGLYSRDSSPRAAFIARNGACYALTAMSVSVLSGNSLINVCRVILWSFKFPEPSRA